MTDGASLFDRHGQRKYLNAAERSRFLRASRRIANPRDRLFCQTLLYSGCRISEALRLTVKDVDVADHSLIFFTLKQRGATVWRSLPVPPALIAGLQALAKNRNPDDRLWNFGRTSGWKCVKTCMRSAKIEGPKATARGLRHAFAIGCTQANVPLTVVQKWLGHSRLETTAIYLEFAGEDRHELARRAWPKL